MRALSLLLVAAVAGCGAADDRTDESSPVDDAGEGAEADAIADAARAEESIGDASPDSPIVLADAGIFDCRGCACDGATHYCLWASGGLVPPPDAPVCEDPDVAGAFGCLPLPAACPSPPSCACLPAPFAGACQCEDVGGGLMVTCYAP